MSDFKHNMLNNKVALVTGGGTGIGREIAKTLGKHGAKIVIASRKLDVLEKTRAAFKAEGIACLAIAADIRDCEAIESLVQKIIAHYGRLDIVVNNAAGNFPAKLEDMSYNAFKTIVDIDLLGTFNVSKACFKGYLKDHGGCIINITAPFEHWGVSFQGHVAAAKTGVESLTRTCAVEWASKHIRVNSVAPGGVSDTEGLDRTAATFKQAKGQQRIGTKQDLANAVLFLVSDSAAFISGVCLRVDGASSIDMLKIPLD